MYIIIRAPPPPWLLFDHKSLTTSTHTHRYRALAITQPAFLVALPCLLGPVLAKVRSGPPYNIHRVDALRPVARLTLHMYNAYIHIQTIAGMAQRPPNPTVGRGLRLLLHYHHDARTPCDGNGGGWTDDEV